MPANEAELDRLLALIAQAVDFDHLAAVDERYRRALACEDVDRPPLVVLSAFTTQWKLPPPFDTFQSYPYSQAYHDPVAMMQNMLLDRVVPGLIVRDDSPLSIRNDHGTVQIASLLGANWQMHGDNYPWVEPLRESQELEQFANQGADVDLQQGGVTQISNRTLDFYRRKLDAFPPCGRAIQISLPDLQGPIDVAEQLRGSDLFIDFYETPDLVDALLDRITNVILRVADHYRQYAVDRLDPVASTQHGYMIPGRLLNRIDSAILVSADMYTEQIRPHDTRLLGELGGGAGGSIHFCGNGEHLVESLLEIGPLRGLDFGQPDMMDVPELHRKALASKVAITQLHPSRDELVTGRAAGQYPTGVVFVYNCTDIDDARQVVDAYAGRA